MPLGLEDMKRFIQVLEKNKVKYVVHAGYGLDGLRGKLTREHGDLDILSTQQYTKKIHKIAEEEGFEIRQTGTAMKLEKEGSKLIDIGLLEKEGTMFVSRGFIAETKFPAVLLKPQKGRINDFEFNVASNELLRLWGSRSKNKNDRRFAQILDVDEKLFDKIKRRMY